MSILQFAALAVLVSAGCTQPDSDEGSQTGDLLGLHLSEGSDCAYNFQCRGALTCRPAGPRSGRCLQRGLESAFCDDYGNFGDDADCVAGLICDRIGAQTRCVPGPSAPSCH